MLEYSGSGDVNPDDTFVINTTAGMYTGAAVPGCRMPIPLCLYRPRWPSQVRGAAQSLLEGLPYRADTNQVIAMLGTRLAVGDELKVQLSVGSVSDKGLTLPGIITGFSVP